MTPRAASRYSEKLRGMRVRSLIRERKVQAMPEGLSSTRLEKLELIKQEIRRRGLDDPSSTKGHE